MKTIRVALVAATISLLVSPIAMAACEPTITITPALGPNILGSPSYTEFQGNYLNFLLDGTPGPDYDLFTGGFLPTGATVDPAEMVVTTFNSWRGQADPTPGWDDGDSVGEFSGELGNRLYFGLCIMADIDCGDNPLDNQICLQDLSGQLQFQDSMGNPAGPNPQFDDPTIPFDFSSNNYSANIWGVIFDDTTGEVTSILNSGESGSIAVDAIYYVGATTGFSFDTVSMLTNQENLDKVIAEIRDDYTDGSLFQIETTYDILTKGGKPATGTTVVELPEPSGFVLILAAIGFFGGKRRV